MLDKTIVDHVEQMDSLEDQITVDINNILSELDIDEIVKDPKEYLTDLAEIISKILIEKYHDKAAEKGLEFAKAVRRDGSVSIQKTNDPNLNAGDIDGDNGES